MILELINAHMNGGRCPSGNSLGECAAISTLTSHYGRQFYQASLYLWQAAENLKPAEVASWFEEIGCTDVTVYAVLHDQDNDTFDGVTEDGVRPWVVDFLVDDETRERLGL